jgi:hypothetical protein
MRQNCATTSDIHTPPFWQKMTGIPFSHHFCFVSHSITFCGTPDIEGVLDDVDRESGYNSSCIQKEEGEGTSSWA